MTIISKRELDSTDSASWPVSYFLCHLTQNLQTVCPSHRSSSWHFSMGMRNNITTVWDLKFHGVEKLYCCAPWFENSVQSRRLFLMFRLILPRLSSGYETASIWCVDNYHNPELACLLYFILLYVSGALHWPQGVNLSMKYHWTVVKLLKAPGCNFLSRIVTWDSDLSMKF
jgi:hypothetical protein